MKTDTVFMLIMLQGTFLISGFRRVIPQKTADFKRHILYTSVWFVLETATYTIYEKHEA
jgi:hypothetical protein